MTLHEARNILGPIRTYWSRQNDRWHLDGRPATRKEIIKAAESLWAEMDKRRRNAVLQTPMGV